MAIIPFLLLGLPLASGVVVSFFYDSSCTQPVSSSSGDASLTAFTNQYTPLPLSYRCINSDCHAATIYTGLADNASFVVASACTSGSVTIAAYLGDCSASTLPTPEGIPGPTGGVQCPTLLLPIGSCISHRVAKIQCSGAGGGYLLDRWLKVTDATCAASNPACSGPPAATSCPSGGYLVTTPMKRQVCRSACTPGSYNSNPLYPWACTSCSAGTFSNTNGASSCTSCPMNTFASHGATSCTPCPVGTMSYPQSASCVSSGALDPQCVSCTVGSSSSTWCPYAASRSSVCFPTQYFSQAGDIPTRCAGIAVASGQTCPLMSAMRYDPSFCTLPGSFLNGSVCSSCPPNTTSLAGAVTCTATGSGTSSLNISAIIGGVVAGLVVLTALGVYACCKCCGSSKPSSKADAPGAPLPEPGVSLKVLSPQAAPGASGALAAESGVSDKLGSSAAAAAEAPAAAAVAALELPDIYGHFDLPSHPVVHDSDGELVEEGIVMQAPVAALSRV